MLAGADRLTRLIEQMADRALAREMLAIVDRIAEEAEELLGENDRAGRMPA